MKKAVLSRKAEARVGTPTEEDFIDVVIKGTLTNCPVTPFDIANTCHMFGPDLIGVKIKTVRLKTGRVEVEDVIHIHSDYHRFVSVTFTADVIFVNIMPLFITLYRRIKLLTL